MNKPSWLRSDRNNNIFGSLKCLSHNWLCRIPIHVEVWTQRHCRWGLFRGFCLSVQVGGLPNAQPTSMSAKQLVKEGGHGMADMEGMGGMHGGMEGLRAGLCRLPEGRSADRRVGRWAEKAGGRLPLLRCLTTLQTPFGTHQGKTLAILIIPDLWVLKSR